MDIKFANGTVLPAFMCYNHGDRYICGAMRKNREIAIPGDAIGLDDLRALLSDAANLATIEVTITDTVEVTAEDGAVTYEQRQDTEVLTNYVYADSIRDNMAGEVRFTVAEKTALELENEVAVRTIDALLIAMEV